MQIQAGDNKVKVIVLNRDAMDRTWRVGSDANAKWVTGFDDIDFDPATGRMKGVMTAGRSVLKNRLELPPPALSEWTSSPVVLQAAEETFEAAPRSSLNSAKRLAIFYMNVNVKKLRLETAC